MLVGQELDNGSDRLIAVQQSEAFVRLRRKFRAFAFPMTVVFLSWYLLYVIASGWARGFMGHQLWGNINVAYVFGLLQFVSTFLIAWLYERYMNKNVDPLAEQIRHDLEGSTR
ncbi:MAG: DUF485 domain-containing protein [Actinomycetes bacterium]